MSRHQKELIREAAEFLRTMTIVQPEQREHFLYHAAVLEYVIKRGDME